MSPATPEKPKLSVPFQTALEQVLERYGYADWAVVARKPDGNTKAWWVAGDGQDDEADRNRLARLNLELDALKSLIVARGIEQPRNLHKVPGA